jgi:putative transferase (TIGR04331 family)
MKRYLITTADERSWNTKGPVLFLGEWCRCYDRRSVWSSMDAVVAAPYGLESGQSDRDIAYIKSATSHLLDELSAAANAFHRTSHSRRYWDIVLGHWLVRYVAVMFNRYMTLAQALRRYEISGTTVFDGTAYSLATTDSASFIWACDDDLWNHVLYSRILSHWQHQGLQLHSGPLDGIAGFTTTPALLANKENWLTDIAVSAGSAMLRTLSRHDDALIVSTYLPRPQRIYLELSLGQCPQVWRTPQIRASVPDQPQRDHFFIDASKGNDFERYLRLALPHMIPSCYLEGYAKLVDQAAALPWPARPRFIFTSNSFDTDELFKLWTAAHVEQGVPYFAGQHGNKYGTHVCAGSDVWPEQTTSDGFITWGWRDENPRTIPGFVFKTAGRKAKERGSSGGLLLIELCLPHWHEPHDCYAQFAIYQEQQFRFVNALPDAIRRQLTVRLHAEYRRRHWCDELRWMDRSPQTRLETGTARIHRLIDNSRLVVHSYDSTGILESLALNKPTMCFWHGGLDHILPSARPYYEGLRDAGILADTPERAAAEVESHWEDVGGWWRSEMVQEARQAFCARMCRTDRSPVRTLKRLLNEACRSAVSGQ